MDWAIRLDGATITDSEWVIPSGITEVTHADTDTTASVKLSGGTAGQTYTCTSRVETSAGETLDHSIDIYVTER